MTESKKIKKIYDAISDETSKAIFCSRLLYSMTGDVSLLDCMIEDFNKSAEMNEKWIALKKLLQNLKERPYIFGVGEYGKALCAQTGGAATWSGFIDNAPKMDKCMELPVVKAIDFMKNYAGEIIALPSKAFFFEMREQLLDAGVAEENIIDATAWYDATEGRQYFDLPYLTYGKDEVFVDAGCCDGMSSVRFAQECSGSYKKLYCFEPDWKNIGKIQSNFQLRNIENYEIISKGLWNEQQELLFAANGDANSHITQTDGNNAVKIEVTTLDEVLCGERASFIKMDIEGTEYKALQGAKGTIAEYKPKLAICVYHKPEDIWELPGLVLDIRPDYKLYFKHYSSGSHETVMYAL